MIRLALAGPMGAGKSTLGRAVAARLGVDFVDLDGDLEPIPELFARGEDVFRDAETLALTERVRGAGVLALGGGTLVRPQNRALLAEWRVVVVMATRETLVARLAAQPGARPLAARWESLLQERAAVFASYGAPVLNEGPLEAVVSEVIARC